MLKTFQELVLDCIFPIYCTHCGYPCYVLCPTCLRKIQSLPNDSCPLCGINSSNGLLCIDCRKTSALKRLIACAPYDDRILNKALHELKYNSVYILAHPLAELLGKALNAHYLTNEGNSVLIPIPMHPYKERRRGYNQTIKLAENLSRLTGIPVLKDLLVKDKNTKSQVEIKNRADRLKNMAEAFQVNPKVFEKIGDKRQLILIDDVATTGATLNAAASTLADHGFQDISALTLARQSI